MAVDSAWDIFIAHAGIDRPAAEALYDLLIPHFSVFLDSRCLRLGEDWDSQLAYAQSRSSVTLVLVSSETESAYYQREEIAAAVELARGPDGHRVVPIFIGTDGIPAGVPYGLRLKHGLFVSLDGGLEEVALTLRHALQDSLALSAAAIVDRFRNRTALRRAVRLVPKTGFDSTGSLGVPLRKYVFVGDYEEQRHRTLRSILSNLWIGDAFDAVVNANIDWLAVTFEVGELNRRKLDLKPATWKAAFRILSDPRRAGCFAPSQEEMERLGPPPRDYHSDDQLYWYGRLTIGERRYTEWGFDYYLAAILGINWLCYMGNGITERIPDDPGIASRVFFVRNVAVESLQHSIRDLGRPDDDQILD